MSKNGIEGTAIELITEELSGFLDTKILMLLINRSTRPGFYGLSVNAISQQFNGRAGPESAEKDKLTPIRESLTRLKQRELVYYIRRHSNGNSRRGNRAKWFPSGHAIAQLAFLDQDLAERLSPSFLLHAAEVV